jgi:hypothetical protein
MNEGQRRPAAAMPLALTPAPASTAAEYLPAADPSPVRRRARRTLAACRSPRSSNNDVITRKAVSLFAGGGPAATRAFYTSMPVLEKSLRHSRTVSSRTPNPSSENGRLAQESHGPPQGYDQSCSRKVYISGICESRIGLPCTPSLPPLCRSST